MNKEIANAWITFIEKSNLKDEYRDICKKNDLDRHIQFEKLTRLINNFFVNTKNIKFLTGVLFEYSKKQTYSITESKRIIVDSINKLARKYDTTSIPLLYAISPLTNIDFNTPVFFEFDDYGNIDFINALLELESEGKVKLVKFEILAINDEFDLILKATISLQEKQTRTINFPKIEEVHSLQIVTSSFNDFENIWIVINGDYANKHKMSMRNKQTGKKDGVGYDIYRLARDEKIELNAGFRDYMNNKLFNINKFKKYKKGQIIRQEQGKLTINKDIEFSKTSVELLDSNTAAYFPRFLNKK